MNDASRKGGNHCPLTPKGHTTTERLLTPEIPTHDFVSFVFSFWGCVKILISEKPLRGIPWRKSERGQARSEKRLKEAAH